MEMGILKNRWTNLFQQYADKAYIEKDFVDLADRYSEKHRYYHTLNHVASCLNAFDQVADCVSDKFSMEAALWFHDAIYDPKKNDNENQSAQYAHSFLSKLNIDEQRITKIEHLIKLTKHPSNPVTTDEEYLVDIDLMILSADDKLYDNYERWIRSEYSFAPSLLYKRGRKNLLKSFLDSKRIYRSKYFHDKYEVQARKNIEKAMQRL
jgi:predicted metal-dependent HD superfamily phosphohydrolase